MTLRINTNVAAMNAHRQMEVTNANTAKSMERLSTGLRINRASDDAAGLSISENLRSDIRGTGQAQKNAQDGINMINTAEGGLNEITNVLQRMRELSVQSANDTLNTTDRTNVNKEFTELKDEIDKIATNTKFNGQALLSGTSTYKFHVGSEAGQTLDYTTADMSTGGANLNLTQDVSTQAGANSAMLELDTAIEKVSAHRAEIGAKSNRLEHTSNNLSVMKENLAAAESRIRDTDMAGEMASMSRNQVLSQAGMSMLGQANSAPQAVLNLLRG